MIKISQKTQKFSFSIPHNGGTTFTTHIFNHDLNSYNVDVKSLHISPVPGFSDSSDKFRVRDFYRWEPTTYYGYAFRTLGPVSVRIDTFNMSMGQTVTGNLTLTTY